MNQVLSMKELLIQRVGVFNLYLSNESFNQQPHTNVRGGAKLVCALLKRSKVNIECCEHRDIPRSDMLGSFNINKKIISALQ